MTTRATPPPTTTTVPQTTTTVGRLGAPVEASPIESPKVIESAFGDFEITIPGDWVPLARSADDLHDLATNLADHLPGESASVLGDNAESVVLAAAAWVQSPPGAGFRQNMLMLSTPRDDDSTLVTIADLAADNFDRVGMTNVSVGETQVAQYQALRITSELSDQPDGTVFQSTVFVLSETTMWTFNFATGDPDALGLFEAILATFHPLQTAQ